MLKETWLSPPNRIIWIKAFRERAEIVTIRDGRKFKLRYSTETIFGENKEMVYVSPLRDEFCPAGWFRLEKVTDNLWLTETFSEPRGESIYQVLLREFIKTGYAGVDVKEEWPALEDRQSATLRQGFSSAILAAGQAGRKLEVRTIEGRVYLYRIPKDKYTNE